jgi:RNA polymerase sigma factor (sigma-70 family)
MRMPRTTSPPSAPSSPPLRLEELWLQLRPRLRLILKTYRIPYPDTEDLLQDVLVVAFCKWDTIHTHDAWLLGTLRHKCWLFWKRRRHDLLQGMDMPMLESLSEPLPPVQEQAERIWDLETLAGSLCRRHRAVLWLRYGLGMSTDEVAERTGYHHNSIRKLTCRTVARLQRELVAPPRGAGPKPA